MIDKKNMGVCNNKDNKRKLNAKRHKKLRRKKIMTFYIFFVLIILTTGILFIIHTFFKIENIDIKGSKKYNFSQIRSAAGLEKEDNMFKFSSNMIKKRIKRKLVYIDNVIIKKRLPNTIVIKISDAVPSYVLYVNNKKNIIGNNMRILEVIGKNDTSYNNLVKVDGINIIGKKIGDIIDDSNSKIITLGKLNKAFRANKFDDFIEIDLNSRSNIQLNYQDRITVWLGTESNLDYKIKFIKEILKKNIDKNEKGIINASNLTSTDRVYFTPLKENKLPAKYQESEDSIVDKNEISESN